MKIDVRVVIIIILLLFIAEHNIFDSEDPKEVTVITPTISGRAKKEVDSIVYDTIYVDRYLPGKVIKGDKQIVVDSIYKIKYETAIRDNDSLKAKTLFLESISLDTYQGNLVDDKDITIDGKFVTRGKLLSYDIDYKIKSDTIKYTPKVVTRFPKLSIVGGVKLGLPSNQSNDVIPTIAGHVGFRGKKGNTISLGLDSRKRIMLGYEWTLFKTKN